MSKLDKEKWDKKYAEGAYETKTYPAAFLAEQLSFILAELNKNNDENQFRALDLACGAGRNSHFLSANGFQVDAIDISETGLARAANNAPKNKSSIQWICRDLDDFAASEVGEYHLMLMMRYVDLPLLQTITANLLPGGFVVCEEHLQTAEDVVGPRDPNFRVAPGALKEALVGLQIHHYSESIIIEPNGDKAALARIVAQL